MTSKHGVKHLFPIPVYWSHVENFVSIQNEITKGIEQTNFGMRKDWGNTHYLSDPNFQENFLIKHNCNAFLSELEMHLQKYNSEGLKVTHSWAALFKQYNYGHIHDHLPSNMAGVYYYKTKGSTGNLFFQSPQSYDRRCNIESKEGLLLLFPACLKHGITQNTTNTERISISFNLS